MIDVKLVLFLCGAIISIVLGAYGLYKCAFARGYANGYEDATHGDAVFKSED